MMVCALFFEVPGPHVPASQNVFIVMLHLFLTGPSGKLCALFAMARVGHPL